MKTSLTPAEIQLLAQRLNSIASDCLSLREAGQRVIADTDGEDNAFNGTAIEALAERAGALADLCSVLLGDDLGVVGGDFASWQASPLEHEILDQLRAERAAAPGSA